MPAPVKLPPYQHRIVSLGELTLHVAELEREAPSLLLLHGIGMDWRVWQAISRRLYPHFHLYLVDLRGHGQSGKPEHGYSLAHYAADIEDLIDALGLSQIILAGSSLGGMVTAVVEAPADVVAKRVLIDPPLTGGPVRDVEMLEGILAHKHGPVDELARFLQRYNPRAGRLYLRTMAGMWQEAADGVLTEPLAHRESYFALDTSLQHIDSPTLILQGDPQLGGVLSDAQAGNALALLPHGTLVRVPGAGHAIHAEKPAEFTRLLVEFTSMASYNEVRGREPGVMTDPDA